MPFNLPFVGLEEADHAKIRPIGWSSPQAAVGQPRHQRILERVRAIPPGFVRTYGDIDPRAPRLVGQVLAQTDAVDLPWHRVVRADGTLAKGRRQLALLVREGVPTRGERVDLRRARLPSELGQS